MMEELGRQAKDAARVLAGLTSQAKTDVLLAMADRVEAAEEQILSANSGDLDRGREVEIGDALMDRLRLDSKRIAGIAGGLRKVADLPDPVGQITGGWRLPNGIQVERFRVPLGVVAVIYEARPNVTADAAGLCIRSGNAAILRGSSYALSSNMAIGDALRAALVDQGLPQAGVQIMQDTSRAAAKSLMQAREWIDLLVPRGGPGLISTIENEATVPFVIDGAGNCHVYVDESADLVKSVAIVLNAKTQRPGVCNAAESLVVHHAVAKEFLPMVVPALIDAGVEVRGDAATQSLTDGVLSAVEADWGTEYHDYIMSVKVVPTLDEAIDHVRTYGSGHTDAILTESLDAANAFIAGVDNAVVMVNASTRFTDGEEFGFGAEIGISTQKLHVRGPMGLEALTTERYVLRGDYDVRP